ncbi:MULTISPECIES: SunS family peptide S-glycosyltransferase [Bacillus]|nr:SunS family peptide S-glycosyltransferase [Bacillus cereus]MEB9370601.1 SunS family peptide S-glycosyltransferase [Bacillus cereus]PES49638.1 SunS family peptide S-glycosyltransferase [Bacillus cereus]PFR75394.1 SunS family peptide S-glycosyltransferase [Bacillus cereus]PGM18873.1 SunS family peptide S-glycosyltransferase [Bacillus cereus]PGR73452.1 SunS family peptide S-glycosyltransferase [Bacillus cereus]
MNLYDFYQFVKMNNPNSQLFRDLCLIHNINTCDSIYLNLKDEIDNSIQLYENSDFPLITCGIISYNEERCIQRCIDSVINEFDEIIVLDSVSVDQTTNIIKEKFSEVKIFSELWRNDFSYQRNKLISYACNDWIYFIDADNYYGENNIGKAKRVARLIDFLGIKCVISPMIHEYTGHIYVDTRRLFSLKHNILFSGKVHEEPVFDDKRIPDNIVVTIDVYHDGYNPVIVNQLQKNKRNLELTEQMIQLEPNNPKWLFFYARELNQVKADKKLVKNVLLKAIDLYEFSSEKRFLIESILLLCKISFEMKDFKTLIKYVSLVEKEFPNCYDIEFYKASLLLFDLESRMNTIIESLHIALDATNEHKYSEINSNGDHFKHLLINLYSLKKDWDSVFKLYNEVQTPELKQDFLNNITKLKLKIDEIL